MVASPSYNPKASVLDEFYHLHLIMLIMKLLLTSVRYKAWPVELIHCEATIQTDH